MSAILLAALSFILTFGALFALIRLAPRLGLLDHPDHRKHHAGAVPVIGGLALYATLLATFLSGAASSDNTKPLLIAATIVTIIGAIDDRNHISPRLRLLMQFIVALIAVYGANLRLEHLGSIGLHGEQIYLGPFATAVTIFGVMSVINAMNFIDGLDGLAGGLALIAFAGLWLIFSASGQSTPDLIPVITGGLLAFLLLNARWFGRKKAALFLGDAGSTLLGLLLAWLMVDYSQGGDKIISPVIALWLLAVPLIDFLAIVLRRAAMGRHPFYPDREHLHHILTRATQSDTQTVTAIHTVAFVCASIGILGELNDWPKNVMFYAFLGLFVAGVWALKHSWKMAKFIRQMN